MIRLLHAMKDPLQSERLGRMMDHVDEMRGEEGKWEITQVGNSTLWLEES